MEPIFVTDKPVDGINKLEIFDPVLVDFHDCNYPIRIDGLGYVLGKDNDGYWRAEKLSDEMATYVGDLIEHHKL